MRRGLGGAAVLAAALAGCVQAPPPAPTAPSAPEPRPRAEAPAPRLDPDLVRLYAAQERRLLGSGRLRRDAGIGAQFAADDLARSFVRVALYDEYREGPSGALVQEVTESRLLRWTAPVRLGLTFGASVPAEVARADRARVAGYAARLARASRHPVSMAGTGGGANFHVLVLSEDERRAAGPTVRRLIPRVSPAAVRAVTRMPPSISCLVLAFSEPGASIYTSALAVVRAEHPDLTRLACYHEEIAQGLGLANDDAAARPSIFNDDEEFALLTRFDELLLRMLYDPRLRPGMTPAAAAPIAARIARELVPGRGV